MANEDQNNNNNKDFQRGLLLDTKPKTKKPSMYNVLLLNDDYPIKDILNINILLEASKEGINIIKEHLLWVIGLGDLEH